MTVHLKGRLGNQLFEIAHAISSSPYQRFLKLYFSDGGTLAEQQKQCEKLANVIRTHILTFSMQKSNFDGYRQSEQDFDNKLIRSRFKFQEESCRQLQLQHPEIDFENAIGISVRRGDYLELTAKHVVLPREYYEKAYAEEFSSNGQVVVFSDDIEWCKSMFTFNNQVFLHYDDIVDLQLMSMCRHHIGSCSTFSWWGAWIGEKANSINVFPDEWFVPSYYHAAPADFQKEFAIDRVLPSRWVKLKWFY